MFLLSWTELSSNLRSSFIIVVVLSLLLIILGARFKKYKEDETPKGLFLVIMIIVDYVNNFTKMYFKGNKYRFFAPYLLGISIYLAFANTASLFGLTPPLSNMCVALSLTALTFLMIQFSAIRFNGIKERLKGFVGPVKWLSPLMIPLNLVGEFTTPLAMGLRLFGNILSGVVLSTIVYAFTNWFVYSIATAAILRPVFDIAFGLIQMYVFFMLSTMFLYQAAGDEM